MRETRIGRPRGAARPHQGEFKGRANCDRRRATPRAAGTRAPVQKRPVCRTENDHGPSGRTDRTKFRDQVVAPLPEAGLLEMTIPHKSQSSKQQYRTADAGRVALATTRKA
jgi:hypothetical protein